MAPARSLLVLATLSSTLALRFPPAALSRADLVRAAVGAAVTAAVIPQRSLAIVAGDKVRSLVCVNHSIAN